MCQGATAHKARHPPRPDPAARGRLGVSAAWWVAVARWQPAAVNLKVHVSRALVRARDQVGRLWALSELRICSSLPLIWLGSFITLGFILSFTSGPASLSLVTVSSSFLRLFRKVRDKAVAPDNRGSSCLCGSHPGGQNVVDLVRLFFFGMEGVSESESGSLNALKMDALRACKRLSYAKPHSHQCRDSKISVRINNHPRLIRNQSVLNSFECCVAL